VHGIRILFLTEQGVWDTGQDLMNNRPDTIHLFMPCLADYFYPAIGWATAKVLRNAGFKVHIPQNQTCCGQWAVNIGRPETAVPLARHFLAVFGSAEAVVSPSASCVLTVRNYPELFDDPQLKGMAEHVAARTFDLSEFLVREMGIENIDAEYPIRATLHDSCHPLRGLGLKDEPRRLLGMVEGLELVEMADPEMCCGFGGAFMAKHPELSTAMASQKVDQALATEAQLLIMTEPGCLLNVDSVIRERGVNLRAVHLAEVLAGGIS
jgi:L-lactate dehydrogenase complex protein LldE